MAFDSGDNLYAYDANRGQVRIYKHPFALPTNTPTPTPLSTSTPTPVKILTPTPTKKPTPVPTRLPSSTPTPALVKKADFENN
jgi:N-acetylmuramoyl-L-alanine amidase